MLPKVAGVAAVVLCLLALPRRCNASARETSPATALVAEAGGGLDAVRYHGTTESVAVVGLGYGAGAGARWGRFTILIRAAGALPLVSLPGLHVLGMQARFALDSRVMLVLGGGAALSVPLNKVTHGAAPADFSTGGAVNAGLRLTIWSGRRSLLQVPVECTYVKLRDGFDAQWLRVGLEWAR